jgi:hypothetical protein
MDGQRVKLSQAAEEGSSPFSHLLLVPSGFHVVESPHRIVSLRFTILELHGWLMDDHFNLDAK